MATWVRDGPAPGHLTPVRWTLDSGARGPGRRSRRWVVRRSTRRSSAAKRLSLSARRGGRWRKVARSLGINDNTLGNWVKVEQEAGSALPIRGGCRSQSVARPRVGAKQPLEPPVHLWGGGPPHGAVSGGLGRRARHSPPTNHLQQRKKKLRIGKATTGLEPVNNGFADRRVSQLRHVAEGGAPDQRRPGERMKGLEPSTFCMASRRSSQLSYIREVERS